MGVFDEVPTRKPVFYDSGVRHQSDGNDPVVDTETLRVDRRGFRVLKNWKSMGNTSPNWGSLNSPNRGVPRDRETGRSVGRRLLDGVGTPCLVGPLGSERFRGVDPNHREE